MQRERRFDWFGVIGGICNSHFIRDNGVTQGAEDSNCTGQQSELGTNGSNGKGMYE